MTQLVALFAEIDRIAAQLPAGEIGEALAVCAATHSRLLARMIITPATSPSSAAAALLTANQVAEMFQVPASEVYRLAREGRLPVLRLGKYRRFELAAVRQALADQDGGSETHSILPGKKRRQRKGFSAAATTDLLRRRQGLRQEEGPKGP